MTTYVALLRAVNVGGTGKLPMSELAELCHGLGFRNARTYIQSGNVVFAGTLSEKTVRTRLEKALTEKLGKPADVVVRTAAELTAVWKGNPFPQILPAKVGVFLMTDRADKALLDRVVAPTGEEVRPGKRELYIHFPNGMGRSKLKIPNAVGTVRNMNTIAKLVAITAHSTEIA
jgi:uncharacterized protein (DUF1697 family)